MSKKKQEKNTTECQREEKPHSLCCSCLFLKIYCCFTGAYIVIILNYEAIYNSVAALDAYIFYLYYHH